MNKIEWETERKTFSGKIGNVSFYMVALRNYENKALWNLSVWQAVNDKVQGNAVINKEKISFLEIDDICNEYIENLKKR